MGDLPAKHYLAIYERRLSMSERGITHPAPVVTAGVKILVAALRELQPEEEIRLDASKEKAVFTKASTGELIARIDFE